MYVLITRQLEQSKKFSSVLEESNIKNIILPVISIKHIELKNIDIKNIKKSDFIIFTSQNSVVSLMKKLSSKDFFGKNIAAIGEATTKILGDYKIKVNISPEEDFTSESLLNEIKKNKIKNKKIIIIKGIGGRDLLHKKLSIDNIVFKDIESYERCIPDNLSDFNSFTFKDITHVCITSIDILNNFKKTCDILNLEVLKNIIFVSGNQRIATAVKKSFPANKNLVSLNPTNKEMLNTIIG